MVSPSKTYCLYVKFLPGNVGASFTLFHVVLRHCTTSRKVVLCRSTSRKCWFDGVCVLPHIISRRCASLYVLETLMVRRVASLPHRPTSFLRHLRRFTSLYVPKTMISRRLTPRFSSLDTVLRPWNVVFTSFCAPAASFHKAALWPPSGLVAAL